MKWDRRMTGGLRLEQPQLPALFVGHGRPGFYMRVIEEGHVQAGDAILEVALQHIVRGHSARPPTAIA